MYLVSLLLQVCILVCTDTPVIVNGPTEPKHAQTLLLQEDLRLGPATLDEDLLFMDVNVSVDADPQGNIYVADSGGNRVLVFSPQGALLRQIGREGEGPGEFMALRRFHLLENGGALAFENLQHFSRINWFDSGWQFMRRSERTNTIVRIKDWRAAPKGHLFANEVVRIDTANRILITRFLITDDQLGERAAFGEHRQEEFDTTRVMDQSYWVNYLAGFFARELSGQKGYFSFATNNHLYTAMGGSYEVTEWDAKGKSHRRILRKCKPVFFDEDARQAAVAYEHERLLGELPSDLHRIVTEGVVKQAFRQADLPLAKPPIYGLVAMENGVIVIGDRNHSTGLSRGDLFSKEGRYLGSFSHETRALKNMIFKNGYAYTIGRNEDDDNVLIRYKPTLTSTPGS